MLLFLGTLLVLFAVTVIVVRFMGKSALSQFTPHDLIAIFFIIGLAMSVLEVEGIFQSSIGIVVVIVVHILLSKLSLYNKLNKLVIGEPTIFIKHGKLIRANLKKSRFSLSELLASIRSKGYADISNIQYAILEPSGDISVLPNENAMPVTPNMLGYQLEYQGTPIAVIVEGEIQHRNLELIHKDRDWLMEKVQAAGFTKVNDIFYASVRDSDHSFLVDDGEGKHGSS
ncbi:DUF421 domain-containing protein [Salibacterium salarium]|uniref:DUF421 domain-containing protein n=1 Tax=Salibacterium salarium TaxID=284579 RepID=A0A428MWW0_9BACI|nr:DUF421 domain-containing protein [Salibacterium salarium]RSL30574.1 DUF421 domain-containing protein [Salibacterium salarium]